MLISPFSNVGKKYSKNNLGRIELPFSTYVSNITDLANESSV